LKSNQLKDRGFRAKFPSMILPRGREKWGEEKEERRAKWRGEIKR